MYRVRLEWPAGQHEPVAAGPVRVGRIVPHHLLEQQVRRRGQAHRRTGVAVADLLDRVHREHPHGVDRALVELGPFEAWGWSSRVTPAALLSMADGTPLWCSVPMACSSACSLSTGRHSAAAPGPFARPTRSRVRGALPRSSVAELLSGV